MNFVDELVEKYAQSHSQQTSPLVSEIHELDSNKFRYVQNAVRRTAGCRPAISGSCC